MANLHLYLFIVLLGTFKFMFASTPGVIADLPFEKVYFLATLGGLVSFNFFYFLANHFIRKTLEKNKRKMKLGNYIAKKKFTKTNKTIVKLKMTNAGFWIITIVAPLVLSIPIGSIIVAKFYRHHKETYWITTLSLIFSQAIFTVLAYLIKGHPLSL